MEMNPTQADALRSNMKRLQLCDLHAHLFGMGSAEFWLQQLEILANAHCDEFDLVWDETEGRFFKWGSTTFASLPPEKRELAPAYEDVETQLILTIVSLFRGLNDTGEIIPDELPPHCEQEKRVRQLLHLDEERIRVKDYLVWDARQQKVQKRRGITTKELNTVLQKHNAEVLPKLRNCFEMFDKHVDRDQFTPQFYPRRYALKDDMCHQFLHVIDNLVEEITKRYHKNGVGYAELSISANDAMRPHILAHLPPEKNNVQLRYLAMFPRTAVSRDTDTNQPNFTKLLDLLARFKHALHPTEMAGPAARRDATHLSSKIVGLDFAGDEKDKPDCPFHLSEFQLLLAEQLSAKSPFGFRIHSMERLPRSADGSAAILEHMEMMSRTLVPLLETFREIQPCPFRIGHGIGFGYLLQGQRTREDFTKMLDLLKTMRVPIEVCITSNEFLIFNDHKRLLYWQELLDKGYNVILATDNDGIWKCEEGSFESVAAEVAKAAKLLLTLDIQSLIKSTLDARFGHGDNEPAANALVAGNAPVARTLIRVLKAKLSSPQSLAPQAKPAPKQLREAETAATTTSGTASSAALPVTQSTTTTSACKSRGISEDELTALLLAFPKEVMHWRKLRKAILELLTKAKDPKAFHFQNDLEFHNSEEVLSQIYHTYVDVELVRRALVTAGFGRLANDIFKSEGS